MSESIKLFLPSSIYSKKVVHLAVAHYGDICSIRLLESEDGIECLIFDSVVDLQTTTCEFANYLIELSIRSAVH